MEGDAVEVVSGVPLAERMGPAPLSVVTCAIPLFHTRALSGGESFLSAPAFILILYSLGPALVTVLFIP